jgi:beta-glucosidase
MVAFQLKLAQQISEEQELERTVSPASQTDVAVVVVGTSEELESEGFDRQTLTLPGRQDELVRRIVSANPRTVVVVNTGARSCCPGPRRCRRSWWHGSRPRNSATP